MVTVFFCAYPALCTANMSTIFNTELTHLHLRCPSCLLLSPVEDKDEITSYLLPSTEPFRMRRDMRKTETEYLRLAKVLTENLGRNLWKTNLVEVEQVGRGTLRVRSIKQQE